MSQILKFSASGVTVPIGLGVGAAGLRCPRRLETVFATTILAAIMIGPPDNGAITALVVAIAALIVQLTLVRPWLTRRSDAVLAGHDAPRSRGHYAYVALETLKVAALLVGGIPS